MTELGATTTELSIKRPSPPPLLASASYLFAAWYRNASNGGWVYYSGLSTSKTYPWLMNYLRANDVGRGGYGGYPWPGAGMMRGPVPSVNALMNVRLRILE